MPEYLISDGEEMPKFARLDGGSKIAFVELGAATGFPTADAAKLAFDAACAALAVKCQAKLEAAEAAGDIVAGSRGYGFKLRGKTPPKTVSDKRHLFYPQWLMRLQRKPGSHSISSRPSADDMLGVFETFYVRRANAWLCRSQKRLDAGSLVWGGSFGLAVPFSSFEAAETEIKRLGSDGYVVKTSGVFTAVRAVGRPGPDQESQRIAAACEARDIESALIQSSRDRLDALRSADQAAAPEPKIPARHRL